MRNIQFKNFMSQKILLIYYENTNASLKCHMTGACPSAWVTQAVPLVHDIHVRIRGNMCIF